MESEAKKWWEVEKVTLSAKSERVLKQNGGISLFSCMNHYSIILVVLAFQNGLAYACRSCRGEIVDKIVSESFHVFMKKLGGKSRFSIVSYSI
tara:strand:+ start:126 stop:404 length:279 start_codon:yes stop_codon:yes gene_type:complete